MGYFIGMYKFKVETRKDLESAMSFCGSKNVIFSKKRNEWRTGRGNPLLSRKRFTTIDEIDSRIENLFEKDNK